MYCEKVTYTDYNGNERTEECMFNLKMDELVEMQLGVDGGLSAKLTKIQENYDVAKAIAFFKELLLKSYGMKSDDGRRFIKSKELSEEFSQTEAYSILFMKFATDDKAAAEFINKVVPADLSKKAAAMANEQPALAPVANV